MRVWLAVAGAAFLLVAAAVAAAAVLRPDADPEPANAPLLGPDAWRHVPEPGPEPARFTVSVSGDVLMHAPLLARALANGGGDGYDFTPFFRAIRPWVARVDLGICHLETPLGPGPPATYPIFNTPTALAPAIRSSGWDACSTASNHSLDKGLAGIAATASALDRERIEHTGSFASARSEKRATVLRVKGVRLGLLAYTDFTNGIPAPNAWAVNEYDPADPKAAARTILADAHAARRAGADAVIVNIHWGDEYASAPNPSQLQVAARLTASPLITALVGQGPHVVQPIRRINDKFVVFSSGNLVSNQSAASGLPAATQDGLIALLDFVAAGDRIRVRRVRYLPIWVRPGDYTVLAARRGADRAHTAALRGSYARTVAVAGRGARVTPLPGP